MPAYICQPDQPYQTPGGCWDQPRIYAYDADALIDGVDQLNLDLETQADAEFILRKIDGAGLVVNPVTGRILLRDWLGQPTSRRPLSAGLLRSTAVLPERHFPPGSGIGFDLYTVLRASNVVGPNTTFLSQLAFQGLHRRKGQPLDSRYGYRQKPFIYTVPLLVNWLWLTLPNYQLGIVPVNNRDFELNAIRLYVANSGAIPGPGVLLKMQLYDCFERPLANVPILMDYWMENSEVFVGNALCAPLLYPVGSEIRYQITSLALAGQVPLNYELEFVGMQRFPV